jgi:hypothetical protein
VGKKKTTGADKWPAVTTVDHVLSTQWQTLTDRPRASASQQVTMTRYVWSAVYVDAMIARDESLHGEPQTLADLQPELLNRTYGDARQPSLRGQRAEVIASG